MNERIKELVKQAGGHFSTHTLTSNPVQYRESIGLWDNNIEKFAELIVRECVKAADEWYQYHNEIQWDPGEHIKQHFGVEE